MAKAKRPTYDQLLRQNKELLAGLAVTSAHALMNLSKAQDLMASGIMLQLSYSGGKEVMPPVMIRDGLSKSSVDALKADIQRSLDLTKSGV